jgi:hypothetical protein
MPDDAELTQQHLSAPTQSFESSQSAARDKLHSHLSRYFCSPDLQGVEIILAACRAHYFSSSKPIWMWIVGPSGSGKTEIGIRVVEGLPGSFSVGDLTTKAFMTAKKGQKGILHRLPKYGTGSGNSGDKHHGILTFKDFTTFLSKRPDDRAELAAQIREISDGYWSRHTGESSDKCWEGKVSAIAACTYELEHMWGMLKRMGERFINLHWRFPNDFDSSIREKILLQTGMEDQIAYTTKSLAAKYFGNLGFTKSPAIPREMTDKIIELCRLSCWMRESVYRNPHSGKIEDTGPRESISRLNKSIHLVVAGYASLRGREVVDEDIDVAKRLAWDAVPTRRAALINALRDGADANTSDLSRVTKIPRSSIIREIDDLAEIGILVKVSSSTHNTARLTDSFMSVLG